MVCVIGGGAAGLFAASRIGAEATVIEHSEKTCLKLGITGKGRCNLTNNCDLNTLLANVPRNPKFLYSAFSSFSAQDTMAFFESLGVKLKTERGGRVFPESDRAMEIVGALRDCARARGVRIIKAEAKSIETKDGAVCSVETDKGKIPCDAVILATGGKSYPATGSDGSGYTIAEKLGHTIIAPQTSLVPLDADTALCAPLSGLTLKNIGLTVLDETGKNIYSDFGELLFTHFGVSGPVILSASARIRGKGKLILDLKPALDEKTLDARLLRDFAELSNINFSNYVPKLLPASMTDAIVSMSKVEREKKTSLITREDRKNIIHSLKSFEIEYYGKRGFDEAIVTSGGVSTKEINPKTMESKLVKNLYFAGEIIDIDAYTGGFNLQIAWSTAASAARSVM